MKSFLLILVLFLGPFINAQEFEKEKMEKMSDEEVLEFWDFHNADSINASFIARHYLKRGRLRNDTIMMARGYDRLARSFSVDTNLKYADSIIELTKGIDNITYPGLGYIIKGSLFNSKSDLASSFDNYLTANRIALKQNNQSHLGHISKNLVFFKILWGNKSEGLKIQRARNDFIYKTEYRENFKLSTRVSAYDRIDEFINVDKINSMSLLSFCYLYNNQLDSTYIYAQRSHDLNENTRPYNYKSNINFVDEIFMELYFFTKEYNKSILYGEKLESSLGKNISNSRLMNVYFYKGMALYDSGFVDKGIEYLKKADLLSDTKKNLKYDPNDRELFFRLKSFYAGQNNLEKENEYLGKLIKIDSLIKVNYKIVEPTIINQFKTPDLLKAKNDLIKTLSEEKSSSRATQMGLSVFVVIIGLLCWLLYEKQKQYKKRYRDLVNGELYQNSRGVVDIKTKQEVGAISSDVIEDILEKLDRFERKKGFLSAQLSLRKLATDLNTNPNYLSRIINLKIEKNFSQYINDLRISFVLEEIKTNTRFRKYSIKAIARECGFNSSSSFTRAFHKTTGLYPSYFIKQLEKDKKVG